MFLLFVTEIDRISFEQLFPPEGTLIFSSNQDGSL